jgi:hypothetical protein
MSVPGRCIVLYLSWRGLTLVRLSHFDLRVVQRHFQCRFKPVKLQAFGVYSESNSCQMTLRLSGVGCSSLALGEKPQTP